MTTLRRVILESKKHDKVHVNTNFSSSDESDRDNEVSPRTRRKIELLEQQTKNTKPTPVENHEKKFIKDENKDYTLCAVCEAGGNLLKCTGLCNRSFHETCMEFRLTSDAEGVICFDCLRKKNFCNFCKTEGSIVQTRKKCLKLCIQCKDKFYCQNCIENEKTFESVFPVICPLHHCTVCGYPGSNKANYLVQCVRCTNAYHIKCLPSNFQKINDIYIVCPVHLPTKVISNNSPTKSSYNNNNGSNSSSNKSNRDSMTSIQIKENGVVTSSSSATKKHRKHKHYSNYDSDSDDDNEDIPLPILHRSSTSSSTPSSSTPTQYKYNNNDFYYNQQHQSYNIKNSPLSDSDASDIEPKKKRKKRKKKSEYDDDEDDDDDYYFEDDEDEYETTKSIKRKSDLKSLSYSSSDNSIVEQSVKKKKKKRTSTTTTTNSSNTTTPKSPKIITITNITSSRMRTSNSKDSKPTPKKAITTTPSNTPTATSTFINNAMPKVELKLTSSKVITMIDSPLTIATQTERPILSLSTSFTSLIYGTIVHNNKNVVDIKTETFMCNRILSLLENKALNINKLYIGLKNEGCTGNININRLMGILLEEQLVMKAPNFETTGNYILSNPNLKFYCGPMKSIKPWKGTSS